MGWTSERVNDRAGCDFGALTPSEKNITRYADMLRAMGTESRLRIMQLLLSAHPGGLVVREIGDQLEIPSSTLSHHLEKLKDEDLMKVRREGTSSGIPPIPKRFKNCWAYDRRLVDDSGNLTCLIVRLR
jgi:DNA-binding transcriptional ArsR family regulator